MAQTAKPYATVPTLFDRVQDELTAIEQITRVLGSLPDHETRVRVITGSASASRRAFPARNTARLTWRPHTDPSTRA